MVYYTGDIHGGSYEIVSLCKKLRLTNEDVVVILGDAGINFFQNERDMQLKRVFSKLKPTIFCIHGNHEIRPANILSYRTKTWNGGVVWYEEAHPNILFARDGEVFTMDGLTHLVIGGAYSVDKLYRLARGYGWWPDEQPSDEIKRYVEQQALGKHFDVILSHTCPYRYEPRETFLPYIDQSQVDKSTELWLDKIEAETDYDAWLCGHYHINKRIDKLDFLYHNVISSEELRERKTIRKNIDVTAPPTTAQMEMLSKAAMLPMPEDAEYPGISPEELKQARKASERRKQEV